MPGERIAVGIFDSVSCPTECLGRLSTMPRREATGNQAIGIYYIDLCDQLAVAGPAVSRRGRDQLTVDLATNLPGITSPLPPVIPRGGAGAGATNLPWL